MSSLQPTRFAEYGLSSSMLARGGHFFGMLPGSGGGGGSTSGDMFGRRNTAMRRATYGARHVPDPDYPGGAGSGGGYPGRDPGRGGLYGYGGAAGYQPDPAVDPRLNADPNGLADQAGPGVGQPMDGGPGPQRQNIPAAGGGIGASDALAGRFAAMGMGGDPYQQQQPGPPGAGGAGHGMDQYPQQQPLGRQRSFGAAGGGPRPASPGVQRLGNPQNFQNNSFPGRQPIGGPGGGGYRDPRFGAGMGMVGQGMQQDMYDQQDDFFGPMAGPPGGVGGQYDGRPSARDPYNPAQQHGYTRERFGHSFQRRRGLGGDAGAGGGAGGGGYGADAPYGAGGGPYGGVMSDPFDLDDRERYGGGRMSFDERRYGGGYPGEYGPGGRHAGMGDRYGDEFRDVAERDRFERGPGSYGRLPGGAGGFAGSGPSGFGPGPAGGRFGTPGRGFGYNERSYGMDRYGQYADGPGGGRGGYGGTSRFGLGSAGPGYGRGMGGVGEPGSFGHGAGRAGYFGGASGVGAQYGDLLESGGPDGRFGPGRVGRAGFGDRDFDPRELYDDRFFPGPQHMPFPGGMPRPRAYPDMMGANVLARTSRHTMYPGLENLDPEVSREAIRLLRRHERYSGRGRMRTRPKPEKADLAGFLVGKLLGSSGITPESHGGFYQEYLDMYTNGQAKYGNGDEQLSQFRTNGRRRRLGSGGMGESPRNRRRRPGYGDNSSTSTGSDSD